VAVMSISSRMMGTSGAAMKVLQKLTKKPNHARWKTCEAEARRAKA
jgi:hypothetical protein